MSRVACNVGRFATFGRSLPLLEQLEIGTNDTRGAGNRLFGKSELDHLSRPFQSSPLLTINAFAIR